MKTTQKSDKLSRDNRFEDVSQAWTQFKADFPGKEDCLREILLRALKTGVLRCQRCGLVPAEKSALDGRFIRCPACQNQIWITGDCIFRSVRNLQVWFGAIWLMERGITFNASDLHKVGEVAYSSAWNIFHRLSMVIEQELASEPLLASSALLSEFVCKRSRETSARLHPRSEEESAQASESNSQGGRGKNGAADSDRRDSFSRGTDDASDPNQTPHYADVTSRQHHSCVEFVSTESADAATKILQLLEAGPLHFDQLCELSSLSAGQLSVALSVLEIDGKIEAIGGARFRVFPQRNKTSDKPPKKIPAALPSGLTSGLVENIDASFFSRNSEHYDTSDTRADQDDPYEEQTFRPFLTKLLLFLKHNFHGASRKYLQLYLMAFWIRADRQFWCPGALIDACLRSQAVSREQFEQYISPQLCKVVPLSVMARLAKDLRAEPRILPIAFGG